MIISSIRIIISTIANTRLNRGISFFPFKTHRGYKPSRSAVQCNTKFSLKLSFYICINKPHLQKDKVSLFAHINTLLKTIFV